MAGFEVITEARTSRPQKKAPKPSRAAASTGPQHLAYKTEQAVDMNTGAIVAITTQGGATGDTTSVLDTVPAAGVAVAEQIATPTAKGQY